MKNEKKIKQKTKKKKKNCERKGKEKEKKEEGQKKDLLYIYIIGFFTLVRLRRLDFNRYPFYLGLFIL